MTQKTRKPGLYGSEAELLIRELGEPDVNRGHRRFGIVEMTEIWHEKDLLDPCRFMLIEFAAELAGFAHSAAVLDKKGAAKAGLRILELLSSLSEMPGQDGSVLIRHRGRDSDAVGQESMDADYVMVFGAMSMDMAQATAVARRLGAVAAHRPAILRDAFSTLAGLGIRTVRFALESGDEMRLCLRVLFEYLSVTAPGKPMENNAAPKSAFIINDEEDRPDANLTLFAAVNRMDKKTARLLVAKIHSAVARAGSNHPLAQFPNVYEACFAFKRMRESLKRSPIEINNPRWLVASHEWEMIPAHRARLARMAADAFGSGSPMPGQIMDGLYAPDYGSIGARVLSTRLIRISRFIEVLEKSETASGDVVINALSDAGKCLDMVQENVFDDFWILADKLELRISDRESGPVPVDARIHDLFAFYSQRSITKQKVRLMAREDISFKERDYQTIARDFGFTLEDARTLLELIRNCFDGSGRFMKARFDSCIPEFAQHHVKVFEFLWHYLKENLNAGERVAFLNGQLRLIDKINHPHGAIRVLLEDLAHDPEVVRYTDRNALMLANALLRTFNKELDQEIEMTPEDVLKVRQGLDQRAVRYAARLIDEDRQRYFLKARSIHRKLLESLDPREGQKPMPLGYIITLERELYIFLSLVGGVTGLAVLRSALREYGVCDSEVYRLRFSKENMKVLLQHLQVVVRAAGRVAEKEDWEFLFQMEARSHDFYALDKSAGGREQVKQTLGWLNKTLKEREG